MLTYSFACGTDDVSAHKGASKFALIKKTFTLKGLLFEIDVILSLYRAYSLARLFMQSYDKHALAQL